MWLISTSWGNSLSSELLKNPQGGASYLYYVSWLQFIWHMLISSGPSIPVYDFDTCLIYIFSWSRSPLSIFLDVSWRPECLSQSSSFCNTWFAPQSALDSQVLLLHGWTNSLGVIHLGVCEECRISRPAPDLMNQNLHFHKILSDSYKWMFESHRL